MDGVVLIAKSFDSVGGMARSPKDLALVTEAITNSSALPSAGYLRGMTGIWDGIRLGFLDESPDFLCEFNSEALGQMVYWLLLDPFVQCFIANIPYRTKNTIPPWKCFVYMVPISNIPLAFREQRMFGRDYARSCVRLLLHPHPLVMANHQKSTNFTRVSTSISKAWSTPKSAALRN